MASHRGFNARVVYMLFVMDRLSQLFRLLWFSFASYQSTRAPHLFTHRRCITDVVCYAELQSDPSPETK
jgi:hypothetical protein